MKLKKKSGLIGLISVLAGVSVVSVGFASWVVSAGDTKIVDGDINVETMSDQRHTLSAITFADGSNKNVKYGVPATPSVGKGNVLSYEATDARENLQFTFTFSVDHFYKTVDQTTTRIADLEISFKSFGNVSYYKQGGNPEFTDTEAAGYEAKTGYEAAQIKTLVGALPSFKFSTATEEGDVYTGTNIVVTQTSVSGDTANFSATATFEWGSHFEGHNPFEYYNHDYVDQDALNLAAEDAAQSLSALQSLLTGVTYKMTVTTSHGA